MFKSNTVDVLICPCSLFILYQPVCEIQIKYITWHYYLFIHFAYTTRMLQPIWIQDLLKIRESGAHALFLYNCTQNTSHSADASVSVAYGWFTWVQGWFIFYTGNFILLVIFYWLLNFLKCLIYHIIKDKKVCLRCVWIKLTTTRELWQNNALALKFWCVFNALTLWVCALNASKYQGAYIILSQFTQIRSSIRVWVHGNLEFCFKPCEDICFLALSKVNKL